MALIISKEIVEYPINGMIAAVKTDMDILCEEGCLSSFSKFPLTKTGPG
ncbi:hypothetical protein P5G62_022100 [Neobacillus sp. 179-C4.2 HS]|uniref:Uncharacterized protein n=1 Tax=Neobacillus driksii TaxID=3035913 RepID=A0ABV4YYL6_9BACI|nr:hypothetical protein [Neobacillus sp. 179.-C4.2 HS]MDP5194382.1 hypothetical protein [Neobacillus sp. 179.-C4.2 HS]